MINNKGYPRLIDFGLAKRVNRSNRARTQCGTLQYMAPETITGEKYDCAVDWWALGVTLYVLLAGRLPFQSCQSRAPFVPELKGGDDCAYFGEQVDYNAKLEVDDITEVDDWTTTF